jgi:hypothetical protein
MMGARNIFKLNDNIVYALNAPIPFADLPLIASDAGIA